MKKLFLTLCTLAALSGSAFAGNYTLEDFNNDQDWRAWQADQNANRRAQELQDKLDEIEAERENPVDPDDWINTYRQPQTLPRVQTFADGVNAGKTQELIKSWQIGETRPVQMRDGKTLNATLIGQVDSYNHLPRRGKPGDAWMVAGTPWVWAHPAGSNMSTWIDL